MKKHSEATELGLWQIFGLVNLKVRSLGFVVDGSRRMQHGRKRPQEPCVFVRSQEILERLRRSYW